MKKIILVMMMVILLSGCSLTFATSPKQKVIELLDKYKNQDQTILSQLDNVIGDEYTNSQYRERYKTLMINQYKNMEYKIIEEEVEGNNAVVEAEITVYDYASALRNANDYLSENPDKFTRSTQKAKDENSTSTNNSTSQTDNNEMKNNQTTSANDYDEDKFTDYKITQMENTSDKVTYTLEFTLTKVNGKWQLDSMSNSDIEKIHGIYIQG